MDAYLFAIILLKMDEVTFENAVIRVVKIFRFLPRQSDRVSARSTCFYVGDCTRIDCGDVFNKTSTIVYWSKLHLVFFIALPNNFHNNTFCYYHYQKYCLYYHPCIRF